MFGFLTVLTWAALSACVVFAGILLHDDGKAYGMWVVYAGIGMFFMLCLVSDFNY